MSLLQGYIPAARMPFPLRSPKSGWVKVGRCHRAPIIFAELDLSQNTSQIAIYGDCLLPLPLDGGTADAFRAQDQVWLLPEIR